LDRTFVLFFDRMVSLHSTTIWRASSAAQHFGTDPGLLVALPYRGWAPFLLVPEGYYALVTDSGAEMKTITGSPVWPSGYISAGSLMINSNSRFCHLTYPYLKLFASDISLASAIW
jgi:hypothetical protein